MRKPNILIPMAGLGSRFQKEGFTVPKQLINVGQKHLIDLSLACLKIDDCNLIFIIRDEHVYNFRMDEILKHKFGQTCEVIVLDHLTRGSVESCLYAKNMINNDAPLIIHTLDIEFEPQFNPYDMYKKLEDGLILTFKSNSINYSYAKSDRGLVTETAEKKAISTDACVGIYGFKRGSDFVKYAEQMIEKDIRTNNEFYIAPLYNLLIQNGLKITTQSVDKMHVFGTPDEYRFYKNHAIKNLGNTIKPIAICSDHSGYFEKEVFKRVLEEYYHMKHIDFGTFVNRDCNYKDYIAQAVRSIQEGESDIGFAFCRTGQGVNMCANKFKGIRSALIYDTYAMEMAIRHNCANFFSIPAKLATKDWLTELMTISMRHTFDGGRHQMRIQELES
ncbi:RpiB/LacA/LacB family sugar-phosphate isomerase [bacterium]|nr:RpiB/LacA/LacB family sugar-phosphate isomerase [bacterium]